MRAAKAAIADGATGRLSRGFAALVSAERVFTTVERATCCRRLPAVEIVAVSI